MATFELKRNLPKATQDKLDALLAKQDAGEFISTADQAFLDSLSPYQVNKVLRYDTTHLDVPQEAIFKPHALAEPAQRNLLEERKVSQVDSRVPDVG